MAKATIISEKLLPTLGLNMHQFERQIKASNGAVVKAVERKADISTNLIEKILRAYPSIRRGWLMTGKGEIFESEPNNDTLEEPSVPYGNADPYKDRYIALLEANREEAKAREEKMFHLLTGYVSKGTFQVFAAKVDALQEFVVEKVAKFGKTSLEEVSAGLGIKQAEVWKDYEKGTRTYESSSSRGK